MDTSMGMRLTGCVFVLLALSGVVQAGEWAVGLGVVVGPDPYVGDGQDNVAPIPFVAYEGERFSFNPGSANYEFSLATNLTMSLVGALRFEEFDPDDDPALAGLQQRDPGLDLGAAFDYETDFGVFSFETLADVSRRSDGVEASLSYSVPLFGGKRWNLTPTLGLNWKSRELVDYYYGVRRAEAAASQFSLYRGEESLGLEVGVQTFVSLGGRRTLLAGLTYEHFGDGVADSPIVEDDYQFGGFAGVLWRFGK